MGVHTGYTMKHAGRANKDDWQIVRACQDEIRRIRRTPSLPDSAIPEMQRRLRDICETHGWPVPKEADHD